MKDKLFPTIHFLNKESEEQYTKDIESAGFHAIQVGPTINIGEVHRRRFTILDPLLPIQLRDQIYNIFCKRLKKLHITNIQKPEPQNDSESFSIDFHIENKSQYLESYLRCCHVLFHKFKLDKPKICQNGWTMWEKDGLCISLELKACEIGDKYPTTETQVIRVWKKEE